MYTYVHILVYIDINMCGIVETEAAACCAENFNFSVIGVTEGNFIIINTRKYRSSSCVLACMCVRVVVYVRVRGSSALQL